MNRFVRLIGFASLMVAIVVASGIAAVPDRLQWKKLDTSAVTKLIDQEILSRLQAEKIDPSPLADDSEFVRRVWLDRRRHSASQQGEGVPRQHGYQQTGQAHR
jgi:hypothetical protein